MGKAKTSVDELKQVPGERLSWRLSLTEAGTRYPAPRRYASKYRTLPFQIYTVHKGTYSLVGEHGLEIVTITGKRRLDAIIDFLVQAGETEFQKLRELAYAWRKQNPRK